MNISLLITTYDSANFLRECLRSASYQSLQPSEIIIADDGSGSDTKLVVDEFRNEQKTKIIHVWQEDLGFRLNQIRNKGIFAARNEYIVQIDGDLLLHPNFLEDHARLAKENSFICGGREYLTQAETLKLFELPSRVRKYGAVTPKNPFRNGLSQVRATVWSPALASLCSGIYKSSSLKQVFGANFSFWKKDAIAVNGFDEEMVGWGKDDNEFVQRLLNNGISRTTLFFGGLTQHLFHSQNASCASEVNVKRYEATLKNRKTKCEIGISGSSDG